MLSVKNTTNLKPKIKFEVIKNEILGKHYELSLVLCANTMMRRLSTEHKGNTKHINVLSFPISDSEGEIFINLYNGDTLHLFIHACLHLGSYSHSEEMQKLEDKFIQKFKQ